MTDKKKALIEAICDEYGLDYPELGDNGDENDERTEEEIYEDKLKSYDFTSGCYIRGEWLSLEKIVEIADSIGLLEDD